MKKALRKLSLLFLLTCLFSFTILAQGNGGQMQKQSIELNKPSDRFPLFVEQPLNNLIELCGLEAGAQYHITPSHDDPDLTVSYELTPTDPDLVVEEDGQGGFYVKVPEECLSFTLQVNNWPMGEQLHWFTLSVGLMGVDGQQPSWNRILSVDQSYSPQELIEDVFIGGGCFDVTNVIPIGPTAGMGFFSGGGGIFGFEEGVILASGTATNAEGPNNAEGAGNGIGGGGDPDLAALSGFNIFDAVGIQFDFTPTVDQISFEFVFGSEEYCEWVNSSFNDVFGFFISGPGINGTFSNGSDNLAIVPGNGLPISIKTINTVANAGFFVSNGPNCAGYTNQAGIQYDGYTITMVATANVIPCETYTIKLVIGDGSDSILDSGVFLKANSFQAGGIAGIDQEPPAATGGIFYEDCDEGYIVFSRQTQTDIQFPLDIIYNISPNSTATVGADYAPLPTGLSIPPFQDTIKVPLTVFQDGIAEGQETIILQLENSCSCTNDSIIITISDVPELLVDVPDVTVCGNDPASLNASAMGGVGMVYEYLWEGGQTGPSVTLNPPQAGPYFVTVTDECGQEEVEAGNITIVDPPEGTATLLGNNFICDGVPFATVQLDLLGEPPFTINYNLNGIPLNPIQTASSQYFLQLFNPGTYTFTSVIDATGCEGEVTGEITIIELEVEAFLIGTDASCPEVANGMVESVVTMGQIPYTWEWSNGVVGSPGIGGLEAGEYTVTITDANGCFTEETVEIDVGEAPDPEIQIVQEVSCVGDDGSLLASAPNQPPFANLFFNWSNGDNTDLVTGLQGGTYVVTVTEASGCVGVDSIFLAPPETFNTDVQPFGLVTCDDLNAGSADLEVSDGTPPYFYTWSTGDTIQDPTGLGAGFHYVTVTDSDGCKEFDTVFIQSDLVIPTLDILSPDSIDCENPSIAIDATGSSQGPEYNYQWTTNNGFIVDGANSPVVNVGSAGDYTLLLTDLSNGCDTFETVRVDDISFDPQVSIDPAGPLTCAVTELTLQATVNSLGGNLAIQWSTLDGNLVSGDNTLSPVIDEPGTYNLTVIDLLNGCEGTASITVNEDVAAPTASAGPDDVLNCNVNSIILDGTGSSQGNNFTYQWSSPDGNVIDGDTTLTPEIASDGLYILQVFNTSNGCSSADSVQISLSLEIPSADAGLDTLLTCAITSLVLDGAQSDIGPDLEYLWTTPNGNIVSGETTLNPTIDQNGTYQLVVTNTANGCSSLDGVFVDIDTLSPNADAGLNQILDCGVTSLSLDASASDTGAVYTYQWTTIGGNILSGETSLTPLVDNEGSYTIIVTNNETGCTAEDEVLVELDADIPLADAGPPDTLTCAIPSLQLNATASQGPNIFYSWSTSDGNILSGDSTLTPEVNGAGTYELVVTDTSNGCVNTETVVISIDTVAPTAIAGPGTEVNCYQPTYELDPAGTSTGPEFEYLWTTADGSIITNPAGLNPTVDSAGLYQLQVTNTANGCVTTDEVAITENFNVPVADPGPTAELTCVLTEYTLDAGNSSASPTITYTWTSSDGNILSGENTINPVVNEPGTYELLVLDTANGCSATADLVITQDANLPVADAGLPQTLTCAVPDLALDGNASSAGPQYQYTWTTADGNIVSGVNSLQPVVDEPGTYILEVFDSGNNCTVTSQVEVLQDTISPTLDIGNPDLLTCAVQEIDLDASASSAGPNFIYAWTTTNGDIVAGSDSPVPTVADPGQYTLLITNTDNGCTSTETITVDEDVTPPSAQTSVPGPLTCAVTEITISGNGTSQGPLFTYNWSTADGQLVSPPTTLSPEVNEPGTYELLVTNISNGCTTTTTATVEEDVEVPQLNITGGDLLNCNILQVTLDVGISSSNASFSQEWLDPVGNPLGTGTQVSVNAPGSYTVLVMDDFNGCENQASFVVDQDTISPLAEAGAPDILNCEITQLNLDGGQSSSGPIFTYNWTTPDGHIVSGENGTQPLIDDPGVYELLVTNTDNGCTSTDQVVIDEDVTPPTMDAGPENTLTCSLTDLALQATASASGTLSYNWSTQDGNILSGSNTLTPTVNQPGFYYLLVLNEDNRCESLDSVFVNQNITPPDIQIDVVGGSQLDCDTETLSLSGTASSGQGQISYQWSTNDGNFVSGPNTGVPVIDQPGLYTLVITDSQNGCTTTDQVSIDQDLTPPEVVILPPSILTCAVTEVMIDASGSSSGSEFVYDWFTVDGSILQGGDSPQATVNDPGSYTLVVTNTENGCSSSEAIDVEEDVQEPVAVGQATDILDCVVEEVSINAGGSSTGSSFQYQWSTTDGNILSGENTLNPVVGEAGVYTLLVTNTVNGCEKTVDVVVRRDPNFPEAMNFDLRGLVCHGDLADFSVFEVVGGTPPYLYSLEGSPLTTDNIFHDLEPGAYEIMIQDANGCELTETLEIPNVPEISVELPEDIFLVLGDGAQGNRITAQVSPPIDSTYEVLWSPRDFLLFDGNPLAPLISDSIYGTVNYNLTIINQWGCEVSDDIIVHVEKPREIFIPNAFSPNNDGNNDFVYISAGRDVLSVKYFQIFNRWGEKVYEVRNYDPKAFDPMNGWDGTFRGKNVNPAVYVYVAEVEFIDGEVIVYKGDITLVR